MEQLGIILRMTPDLHVIISDVFMHYSVSQQKAFYFSFRLRKRNFPMGLNLVCPFFLSIIQSELLEKKGAQIIEQSSKSPPQETDL